MNAARACYHRGLDIDSDIDRARRLPAALHHDPTWFERVRERVLARTWHAYPGPLPSLEAGLALPWNLLPVSIDEPLVLRVDEQGPVLLSNVSTHSGAILVSRAGNVEALQCPVDGHTYDRDSLASVPTGRWGPMMWASLDPVHPVGELLEPLHERLGFRSPETLKPVPTLSREYHVPAGWLAVCEQALRTASETDDELHLLPWGSLRIAKAGAEQDALPLPTEHPDHGQRIASYHFWLFPGSSIAVHPWGVAVELVLPLTPTETRVVCMGFATDPSSIDKELGIAIDQRVHEAHGRAALVARGLRARLYPGSGYTECERALHHFHRTLAALL